MANRKMKLDFSGVETFQRAEEGLHVCKIATADVKQSQGGNDMIVVAFEVTKGDDKGARVYENYPLVDTALWKLKGMLQAIGMKADGRVQLDLDKLIGKACQVNVIHEEYEGKLRARVESLKKLAAATSDENEDEDDADFEEDEAEEEEAPKKKPAAKAKKKPEPKADEDEDDDDDWDEDEDDDEDPIPAPKKPAKAEKSKATEKKAAKKPAKAEEDDDDDDWDDDDWDE